MAKLIPKQYAKILYELLDGLEEKNREVAFNHFLKFLRKEQVFTKATYILNEFEKYSKEQECIHTVHIKSKIKLSEKLLKEISSKFGEKVEVEEEIDEKMLGGIVVKTGNTILDASLETQLQNLKRSLL